MIRKYFSEMFLKVCMGVGVMMLCATLCAMGILAVLSYIGVI